MTETQHSDVLPQIKANRGETVWINIEVANDIKI